MEYFTKSRFTKSKFTKQGLGCIYFRFQKGFFIFKNGNINGLLPTYQWFLIISKRYPTRKIDLYYYQTLGTIFFNVQHVDSKIRFLLPWHILILLNLFPEAYHWINLLSTEDFLCEKNQTSIMGQWDRQFGLMVQY